MKKPPIIVFVDGISFIPNQGNHTQNIPPITSVKDNNVKSDAGICFEPIEYNIKPKQTKVPCVAKSASFLLDDKKFASFISKITEENKKQNKPPIATVVNLGVSFLQRNVTEKIENPKADTKPKINPGNVFFSVFSKDIIIIPIAAVKIAIHTVKEIFSFKNKNPNKAVMKGIAAKHNKLTAAVVFVIDQMNVIIAVPSPIPPINPEIPILR